MYMPDDEPHYREAFNELYRRTREQIAAPPNLLTD